MGLQHARNPAPRGGLNQAHIYFTKGILYLVDIIYFADIPDEVRNDLLASIDVAEAKILEWKSHIVRGVNQDLARILLLEELKDGECLIIMDWAMKFLPLAFREKQSDWFGQKGVNWHVSVCIFKDENQNLMVISLFKMHIVS